MIKSQNTQKQKKDPSRTSSVFNQGKCTYRIKQSPNTEIRYEREKAFELLEEMSCRQMDTLLSCASDNTIPKSTYRDNTIDELTRCIVDCIRFKGDLAERIGSKECPNDMLTEELDILDRRQTIDGISRMTIAPAKEFSVVSATIDGKGVLILVTFGKCLPNVTLSNLQRNIEQTGGIFYVAKDFASFLGWYVTTFTLPYLQRPVNTSMSKGLCGKTIGQFRNLSQDFTLNINQNQGGYKL